MSNANHSAFLWSVADLLRGEYRQSEFGRVVLTGRIVAMIGELSR